jgi:hypothetical protein
MSTFVQGEHLTLPAQTEGARLGRWIAPLLAVAAASAFALGITTPPRSGPFCVGQCIVYPYTDASQFEGGGPHFLTPEPSRCRTPLSKPGVRTR